MNIDQLYKIYLSHPQVVTDTRQLQHNCLFFALRGPSFNGNAFAKQALEAGASYAVIDDPEFLLDDRTLLVTDVLETLQQLALHHRKQFSIPFLAITGSNGKTTTKELVHAVLSTHFNTATTKGNLNNHIGIPLTILSIQPNAEMAVIEMGANHQREIASYCTYVLPTHGMITNCGKAHLEGFGGVEGVRKGKGELFDFLRAHHGTAFVNNDDAYLPSMSQGIPHCVHYGSTAGEVRGTVLSSNPFLEIRVETNAAQFELSTQLVGSYNLPNILAAVSIGLHFGVPVEKICNGIANYLPSNSRSQLVLKGGNEIVLDAYNANPSSMKLAIENFAALEGKNKLLFLGAMAELGEESLQEHQAIVQLIANYQWLQVVLVGGDFQKIDHPYLRFNNSEEAASWLAAHLFKGVKMLVKGSRSSKMEKIMEAITD
jgi:UDP-N-acetylmuramoyl-tripeptide--D-alanyl-D-alanine ligase